MAFPSPFSSPSWYPTLDDFDPPSYTPNPSVDLFLPPLYPDNVLPQENNAGINFASPEDGAGHISTLPQENNAGINFASPEDCAGHISILPQENNVGINTRYFVSPEDGINTDDYLSVEDNLSVGDWMLNLPPGVKFRPTDEGLITHYLKRQFLDGPDPFSFEPITYADIYDYEPHQLLGMGEDHGDGKRYFYTPIKKMGKLHDHHKKKTTHDRTYRSIKSKKGTWRPTQKARAIIGEKGIIIGYKTPLAYHEGNQKTQWLMQEFKLESYPNSHHSSHRLVLVVVYYHDRRKRGQDNDDYMRTDVIEDETQLGNIDGLNCSAWA